MFAVYDGHGGSEVAEYCSLKLPEFLKELETFKSGDFEQALRDAFIGFDATLLDDKVIEELRQLARKNPDYEDSDMDEDDETAEEIINLHQEATMPLNKVLEKYKGNIEKIATIHTAQRLMAMAPKPKVEASSSEGATGSGSASSSSKPSGSGISPKKSPSDNEVSSSSSKPASESEADTAEPSSSSGSVPKTAPDSTHTIPKLAEESSIVEQSTSVVSSEVSAGSAATSASANGVITGSDYKISQLKSSDDEAISSSSAQENGETASSCPSSSSQPISAPVVGGSADNSSTSSPTSKAPKIPSQISSSSVPDTDTDSDSDDENDATYKDSSKVKPLNSDDDTTDEDLDQDEELSGEEEEEMSGEENEDDCYDDDFMNNMETGPGKASGCTAVVALMSGRDLYVANAGDSRCVVCREGKVVEMSFDHKPEDEIELARIRKAGGRVTLDGRVNGGLNLSRAIGDHGYKVNKDLTAEEQMISALPDLKRLTLEPSDEFMVLACDGIWNYMTNEEVVGFVKQRIDAGKLSLSQICEEVKLMIILLDRSRDFHLILISSCSTTAWHQTRLAMAPAVTT